MNIRLQRRSLAGCACWPGRWPHCQREDRVDLSGIESLTLEKTHAKRPIMLITVLDLEREPIQFHVAIEAGVIDYGSEATQKGPLAVEGRADLIEETHIGEARGARRVVQDIRLRGSYKGGFEAPCARCLEPVEHHLKGHFDLIFRPLGVDGGAPERAISTSETEIGYYQDGGLSLEDVLREQVLLSLPARSLCREDCKGLCPRCGADRNTQSCNCAEAANDPRWEALAGLRSRIEPEKD